MNLADIFKGMPEYVIIKMRDDFPRYKVGQDIDIVCRDIEAVKFHLFKKLRKARVSYRGADHVHFDYMFGDSGRIEIRFDLYAKIISQRFTSDVLKHAEDITFNGHAFRVPLAAYDGVIKCWEYLYNNKNKYSMYAIFKRTLNEYTR